MDSQNSQESHNLLSEQDFRMEILKIRDDCLREISPLYDEICGYAEIEDGLSDSNPDFPSLIEKLTDALSIHLSKILPILEKYKKINSINIGTTFLHIWRGFGIALSGLLLQYQQKIHQIVDPISHRLSFGKGFPNKWKRLANEIKGRIDTANNL